MSNGEITIKLIFGESAVEMHMSSCLAKLHLRDTSATVVFAYEAYLIRPGR